MLVESDPDTMNGRCVSSHTLQEQKMPATFLTSRHHQRVLCAVMCGLGMSVASADNQLQPTPDSISDERDAAEAVKTVELPAELKKLTRGCTSLNPQETVHLDRRHRRVFLRTMVSCRTCVLEMLCVPRGQREHETILSLEARAAEVHMALLGMGVKPGKPVVFFPEYKPPQGPPLQLTVHWVDGGGQQLKADARQWIRHSINRYFSFPLKQGPPGIELPHDELRHDPVNEQLIWYGPMSEKQREHLLTLWDDSDYKKGIETFFRMSQPRPMTATFVFAGSRWDTIEGTRRRVYAAEDGHLITVANFSAATIDVAESSSASDGGQLYEAWEERIPEEGTPVLLEIKSLKVEERTKEPPAPQEKPKNGE